MQFDFLAPAGLAQVKKSNNKRSLQGYSDIDHTCTVIHRYALFSFERDVTLAIVWSRYFDINHTSSVPKKSHTYFKYLKTTKSGNSCPFKYLHTQHSQFYRIWRHLKYIKVSKIHIICPLFPIFPQNKVCLKL